MYYFVNVKVFDEIPKGRDLIEYCLKDFFSLGLGNCGSSLSVNEKFIKTVLIIKSWS